MVLLPRHDVNHIKLVAAVILTLSKTNYADTCVSVPTDNKTLRIGYFLQETTPPYRIGAIKLAFDNAKAAGLLAGYNISVSWNLTSNDVKNATFAAMNMINSQNVDVLIGAVYTDTCMPAAILASYVNRPMFGESCRDAVMDDKVKFNTLVRIAGSWAPFGAIFRTIMDVYGWRRVVLLTDTANTYCQYSTNSINNDLKNRPGYYVYLITMSMTPSDAEFNDYFEKLRSRSRSELDLFNVGLCNPKLACSK